MTENHTSPSQRYSLTIEQIETRPGCWNYTRGVVRDASDKIVAEVNRNYHSFEFLWVEDHPNGHDYLVCGANYQGQTVLELDTGNRRDFLPDEAKQGHGFCWVTYTFNRQHQILVVDGCVWAAPYEHRFYMFDDPMNGWPELERESFIDCGGIPPRFNEDGTLSCFETREIDDDSDEEAVSYEAVAFTRFRIQKKPPRLEQCGSWIHPQEQERRAEAQAAREKWEAAWAHHKATDPVYRRMIERVDGSKLLQAREWIALGRTYSGWCDHFIGDEGRITRRLAENQTCGPNAITIDLDWGRESAPIKLQITIRSAAGESITHTDWFERSIDGMNAAIDRAEFFATERA